MKKYPIGFDTVAEKHKKSVVQVYFPHRGTSLVYHTNGGFSRFSKN